MLVGQIGLRIRLAFFLFGIYMTAQAIQAVEKFESKKAYWTLILPLIVVTVFAFCFLILFGLLGSAIRGGNKTNWHLNPNHAEAYHIRRAAHYA